MLLRRDRAITAIGIVLDVALHAGRTETVSAADIAERLGQARRGIEPVLQILTRGGVLESIRGPSGGYRLGRPRRNLKLSDIVDLVLDSGDAAAEGAGGRLQTAVVLPLWAEMEATLHQHLEKLTIDDLIKRAAAQGIKLRSTEPLNFAI